MVHYVKGDVTKSDCDIICHQVNCQGVMNSGVAKAIREKWPEVYDNYKLWYDKEDDKVNLLGEPSLCTLHTLVHILTADFEPQGAAVGAVGILQCQGIFCQLGGGGFV